MQEIDAGDEALKRGEGRCEQRLVDFACARYEVKGVGRGHSSRVDLAMRGLMTLVRRRTDP